MIFTSKYPFKHISEETLKDTIVLTKELIIYGLINGKGCTAKQFAVLGVTDSLKGWKSRLIGKRIYKDTYYTFLKISNNH